MDAKEGPFIWQREAVWRVVRVVTGLFKPISFFMSDIFHTYFKKDTVTTRTTRRANRMTGYMSGAKNYKGRGIAKDLPFILVVRVFIGWSIETNPPQPAQPATMLI